MPKNYRPTEDAGFSGDTIAAGQLLCETLGVMYHPAAAAFYALALYQGDATSLPWPWGEKDLAYLRRRLSVQIETILG